MTTDRAAVLTAAIAKNVQYLSNTGGAVYAEKIKRYSAELWAIQAAEDAAEAARDAAEWTGSFEAALAKFLDAEDEVLKAEGKPYGREGAERGAMPRQAHIELARSIGVLDELGGDDFFGPLVPGASQ